MRWANVVHVGAVLLLTLGCGGEEAPQITSCDQLVLEDPDMIDQFLILNKGLTCELPPPADDARYACTAGPDIPVCGMPSGVTLVGCRCTDGSLECFQRNNETDPLNDMCGS